MMSASMFSSMGIDADESYNPWDNTISRPVTNALLLAEKTGHLQKSNIDDEDFMEETKAKLPSLKLITLLRQITEKREEHNEVCLEVQKLMEEKETRDLTHLDVLESKVKEINNLNSYLQNIITEKGFLLTRLQQPFVGDFLKLEAKYHHFARELFPQIASSLADLTLHIDTVDWASSADLRHHNFDSVLGDLMTSLSKMRTHFQLLCRMRSNVDKVFSPRDTTL